MVVLAFGNLVQEARVWGSQTGQNSMATAETLTSKFGKPLTFSYMVKCAQ